MYRWYLAWLYLRRLRILWISVVGVALGITCVIVVDSIFNGFIGEYRRITQGTRGDVIVSVRPSRAPDGRPVQLRSGIERAISQTSGVGGFAPRSFHHALFPTEKELPPVLGIGQLSLGPVLELHGIDSGAEASVSDFRDFITDDQAEPDRLGREAKSWEREQSAAAVAAGDAEATEGETVEKDEIADHREVLDANDPFDLSWLTTDNSLGVPDGWPILLGEKLAEFLGLRRGDTIELLTYPAGGLSAEADPISGLFVVVGTFRTGNYGTDLGSAYLRLEDLKEFARLPVPIQQYAVKCDPTTGVSEAELVERLRSTLMPLHVDPYDIESWETRAQWVTGAVHNQRIILDALLFIVVGVAAFTLLIALCMTVGQKSRDIGILAAMGGSAPGIASIFTSCGLLVGVVGSMIGWGLGWLVAKYVRRLHAMYSEWSGTPVFREEVYGFEEITAVIDPRVVVACVVGAWITTVLFSFAAAFLAGMKHPVTALRRA